MERHGAGPPQISSLGYRARPQTIVSSKGDCANIHDDLGAMENTLFPQVVVRNALIDPHPRTSVGGITNDVAFISPAEDTYFGRGYLILVTTYRRRSSKPARTRMERYDAVPSQISSPGLRARPHAIVSLKGAHTNIYGELGLMENAISTNLSPEIRRQSRTCVSL